jgi:hypothetical protein
MPTYILRYEDIVSNKFETLSKAFCFLLNVNSIEGTVIEGLLKWNIEKPVNTYKRRIWEDARKRFSPELYKHIKRELGSLLRWFGYVKSAENPNAEYSDDEDTQFSTEKERTIDEINRETMEKVTADFYWLSDQKPLFELNQWEKIINADKKEDSFALYIMS